MFKKVLKRAFGLMILTIFLIVLGACDLKEEPELTQKYQVKLLSRSFVPEQGIADDLTKFLKTTERPRVHVIIQFYEKLSLDEHKLLYESGVLLQRYLGNITYSVSIPREIDLTEEKFKKLVRWAGMFESRDKLKYELAKREFYDWAIDKKTSKVKLLVQFFPDVDRDTVTSDLKFLDLEGKRHGADNSWAVLASSDLIPELTKLDSVRMIQQGPIPFLPLNERGRRVANSDEAQQADFSNPQPAFDKVSGQGFRIGICDSGVEQQHNDFDQINVFGNVGVSRVYNQQPGGGSHGTHVASIAAGNGFNSANNGLPAFSLRGHAPQAEIGDYGHFDGNAQSYYDAIVNDTTDVTNHSYVQSFHIYDAEAESIDLIIRGDGIDNNGNVIPARQQVWASGNNGISSNNGTNEEGYYSAFTSAKNTISVGSVDTRDRRLSDFSSLGPTFDGRIKPDIVAPGCADSIVVPQVGIQAADSNSQGYIGKCGTSMAAPVVSGIIALLMEQFQDTYGVLPDFPSTYKAMLIHSAKDLLKTEEYPTREFDNPDTGDPVIYHAGPDYATGFGLVDAEAARKIVTREKQWKEATLNSTGASNSWCISVPEGTDEIKVVIVWDDEPGDTTTAEDTPKLVNDLDLELMDPDGNIYYPWTLDPLPLTAIPGNGALDPIQIGDVNPAYRDADHINNVEMAQICYPKAGTWTARVKAFDLPLGNAQSYSLVSSHRILDFCFNTIWSICIRYPWICDEIITHKAVSVLKEYGTWFIDPRVPTPLDEICKYVIDCPGCDGFGWAYCPGWRMTIEQLPEDINIIIFDQFGEIILEDKSKLSLRTFKVEKMQSGDQFFILFTDEKGNPYPGKLKLKIKLNSLPDKF